MNKMGGGWLELDSSTLFVFFYFLIFLKEDNNITLDFAI